MFNGFKFAFCAVVALVFAGVNQASTQSLVVRHPNVLITVRPATHQFVIISLQYHHLAVKLITIAIDHLAAIKVMAAIKIQFVLQFVAIQLVQVWSWHHWKRQCKQ